jgi:aromatic ring hydroxylase
LREQMVELIKITEGFYACGVAASGYGKPDAHSKSFMPDQVFANVGKLLLATQIYDMHRIAHYVSGGLVVTLPGPDEDHNPETGGDAWRTCCKPVRTCRTTSASRRRASSRTSRPVIKAAGTA